MLFNQLFKKRGFSETLAILFTSKNYALRVSEFIEKLCQEIGSYYNNYFRVKGEMQKYGVIEFKKNHDGENVIGLTNKGVEIMRILKAISDLMNMDYEEFQEKMKKQKEINSLRRRRAAIKEKQKGEKEQPNKK